MAPTKVILLSCGSYNPPTIMHLRMFEIARDHLHKMGSHVVIGGVISPVHDAYGKKDLTSAAHRCAMLRLALQNNDWIRLSDWETKREGWTTTKTTIQHHQNVLNSWIFDTNDVKHHSEIEDMDWIPEKIKNGTLPEQSPIQVKLLCGADLLESFGKPGLWMEEDIDAIVGQHGLVVVTREGSNPNQFIYDSDLLSKYMHNILIVTEWITNEISSTKIRRALKRGESVKYLLQDSVLDYIYKHEIYNARRTSTIKLELSSNNTGNNYLNIDSKYETAFLTPSPSDITMETPSPVEIISIDIPDSIMKKNLLNSTGFTNGTKLHSIGKVDNNDHLVRDKFIGVMSENGNKLLHTMKSAYPGQAKQIIATETGESHILEEVGSNSDQSKQDPIICKSDIDRTSNPVDNDSCFPVEKDLPLVESENIILEVVSLDANPNLNTLNAESTDKKPDIDCTDFCETANESVASTNDVKKLMEPDDASEAEYSTLLTQAASLPEDVCKDEKIHGPESNEIQCEENCENYDVVKDALEIDGKYLKSLVNSRKSPKKCKDQVDKLIDKEEEPPMVERDPEISSNPELETNNEPPTATKKECSANKILEDGYTQCDKIDSVNSESQTELNLLIGENKKTLRKSRGKILGSPVRVLGQNKLFIIQGSLDSVKFNVPSEKSIRLDAVSKKSKSYESIKYDSSKSISYKSFDISYSDTLKPKSDSTSQLLTAESEHFCTECCYEGDAFVPDGSSLNQETFYTGRSNRSTPVEEDSTECDICSACNLDSTEILDPKSLGIVTDKCDLCEICGDINADFEGDLVMPYAEPVDNSEFASIQENEIEHIASDVVDNDRFEIENCGLELEERDVGDSQRDPEALEREGDNFDSEENQQVDNDEFEIENCGLDNNVRTISRDPSDLTLSMLEDGLLNTARNDFWKDNEKSEGFRGKMSVIYSSNENVRSGKFSLPKYSLPIGPKGAKKISRKGSFIINDSGKVYQDKRRYSSVDNLQHSRQILKLSDRVFQKSKGNKLIASADNIQSNNARSAKLKKLQKSANDIDSLAENFDSSAENFTFSENDLAPGNEDSTNSRRAAKIKIRDSDMVKMILTKHGIKIISEKETAL